MHLASDAQVTRNKNRPGFVVPRRAPSPALSGAWASWRTVKRAVARDAMSWAPERTVRGRRMVGRAASCGMVNSSVKLFEAPQATSQTLKCIQSSQNMQKHLLYQCGLSLVERRSFFNDED